MVQCEHEREHSTEFVAQSLIVKAHRRHQVAAQWNHHGGSKQQSTRPGRGGPQWKKRIRHCLDVMQAKQRCEIEDQIDYLNQREESAGESSTWDRDFEFRMQRCR